MGLWGPSPQSDCVLFPYSVNVEFHGHTVGALVGVDGSNPLGSTAPEAASLRLGGHEHFLGWHCPRVAPVSYQRLFFLWDSQKVVFTGVILMQDHELHVEKEKHNLIKSQDQ